MWRWRRWMPLGVAAWVGGMPGMGWWHAWDKTVDGVGGTDTMGGWHVWPVWYGIGALRMLI